MGHITRLPPIDNLERIDRRLLNPEPLLVARRSADDKTATYSCPWCGGEHTHRVRPGKAMYSKGSHCEVFDRLFGHCYSTHFYLEGEIDPAEAHARHWWRNFDVMLAEHLYRDFPRVVYSVNPDPEETRYWRKFVR